MSLVVIGKLGEVKERHYDTARGPQADLEMEFIQEGQDFVERFLVSYKAWDKVRSFEAGTVVSVPLFLDIKQGGKKGHWIQKIALDVCEVPAA